MPTCWPIAEVPSSTFGKHHVERAVKQWTWEGARSHGPINRQHEAIRRSAPLVLLASPMVPHGRPEWVRGRASFASRR